MQPFARAVLGLALWFAGAGAGAEALPREIKRDDSPLGRPWVAPRATCDLTGSITGSQSFPDSVVIPDADTTGIVVGPLSVASDDSLIGSVVVAVQARHTWMGDLIVTLLYDENCDGTADLQSAVVCRPGRSTCAPGSTVGCSSDWSCDATYMFADSAATPLPVANCTLVGTVPSGCYEPSGAGAGTLAVFAGHRRGGCWSLRVSDNAVADTGWLCGWSVSIQAPIPTAVESRSWTRVKLLYD